MYPPDHVVVLCLTLWRTARLCFRAAARFYISTGRVWEFQFLHVFFQPFLTIKKIIIAILVSVKWWLILVLIFTSWWPMLISFLCAIGQYSHYMANKSLKNVFGLFAYILIGLFVFLLLSSKSYLYIPYRFLIRYRISKMFILWVFYFLDDVLWSKKTF